MNCLIIAAGQGQRIRSRTQAKPLLPVRGVPLIEVVIGAARAGGADAFTIVTGYDGPRVRAYLDSLVERHALSITHVVNERWAEPNGISVLQARTILREPFLLLMSDHLFDPAIVTELLAQSVPNAGVRLAVDHDLANPLVDLDDVTRVQVARGRIETIGKGIETYDAFDTGIFHCTPGLFDALEESIARGDASLSGGIRLLAKDGRAEVFDIGRKFWLDVDDPAVADRAELLLSDAIASRQPEDVCCENAELLVQVMRGLRN